MKPTVAALFVLTLSAASSLGQNPPPPSTVADKALAEYFRAETKRIERDCLVGLTEPEDWASRRDALRKQLFEMLSLDPLPEKTDLKAMVTGSVDHERFRVENLHFQSRPGLYVTGNLYLPKNVDEPAPAVLYVCGHSLVKKDNVSYGNKTAYQHHAAWFASHGYVCLVIDTLQLGEIEGIHHGTYREKMWWWMSRGYTPAGVEAWNCIRALDYLQTRKEVDPNRLGVTGRSGGGAYSWWLTALDDRVKASVPVAGITDLHNHVVDGAVEGHCDCMFIVNTHRWDYPTVAALAAPRPLLITNTDKDAIFPLDGVTRLYWKVRGVYGLGVQDEPYRPFKKDLGLQISEGGHVDSPELQVAAFRWFNRHLKQDDKPIEKAAAKVFEPEQLRVFKDGLPADAINAKVHDTFVPMATAKVPESSEAWAKQRDAWMASLRQKCFAGWPEAAASPPLREAYSAENKAVVLRAYDFESQPHVPLRLYVLHAAGVKKPDRIVCNVLDDEGWKNWLARLRPGFEQQLNQEGGELPPADEQAFGQMPEMLKQSRWLVAAVAPRGIGPGRWSGDEKKQTQIRRRFLLLGQTRDGMRVWDVRRAVQALRSLPEMKDVPLRLQGHEDLAGVALYASLFEPSVTHLHLVNPPKSHMQGPHFLNVLRFVDMPQALAMAAESKQVRVYQQGSDGWSFATETAKALKWPEGRIEFRSGQE